LVKLNKIYTRTGDDGTTGLVDGTRVAKSDARMAAIGDVDEANSAIGIAVTALGESDHAALLQGIQNDLFDLGADLATPIGDTPDPEWALRIIPGQVDRLEAAIDEVLDALLGARGVEAEHREEFAAHAHLRFGCRRRYGIRRLRAGREQQRQRQ